MRKTLLLMVMGSAFAATASAQINRGTVMVGGSLGVGTQKNEGTNDPNPAKSSSVSVYPSLGFFVQDNLAIGIRPGYGGNTYRYQNSVQKLRNVSADFFARKYLPLGKSFYLFGEGSVGYFRNKLATNGGAGTTESAATTNGIAVAAYPGISYAVNRRLQLEAGLSNLLNISYSSTRYTSTAAQPAGTTQSSGFNAGVGIGSNIPISLGFRLFFGK